MAMADIGQLKRSAKPECDIMMNLISAFDCHSLFVSWRRSVSKPNHCDKVINPKYYKTQINIVLLLLLGRLGRQGITDSCCNFAKVLFFSYFHGQNEYKIRVSLHC